ncbi:hypothetical protein Adt_24498 [Abeliophyllum distichum]|uniref:Uncharacterized protein n=1 Tax=Abeliophyllum distichum TaxID=126358 RepID=A0ABD1SDX2_9LAMI
MTFALLPSLAPLINNRGPELGGLLLRLSPTWCSTWPGQSQTCLAGSHLLFRGGWEKKVKKKRLLFCARGFEKRRLREEACSFMSKEVSEEKVKKKMLFFYADEDSRDCVCTKPPLTPVISRE